MKLKDGVTPLAHAMPSKLPPIFIAASIFARKFLSDTFRLRARLDGVLCRDEQMSEVEGHQSTAECHNVGLSAATATTEVDQHTSFRCDGGNVLSRRNRPFATKIATDQPRAKCHL